MNARKASARTTPAAASAATASLAGAHTESTRSTKTRLAAGIPPAHCGLTQSEHINLRPWVYSATVLGRPPGRTSRFTVCEVTRVSEKFAEWKVKRKNKARNYFSLSMYSPVTAHLSDLSINLFILSQKMFCHLCPRSSFFIFR